MHKTPLLHIALCCLLLSWQARASITLPKILGDNMVLQRNAPVAVWGWAAKGEKVTVAFAGNQKSATADGEGRWNVRLDPMPASAEPRDLTVSGSNTVVLKNILVGEVWLCSGQSNMEYTMMKESKFADALRSKGLDSAALKAERNPFIRLFLVKRDLTKPDGGGVNKGWNEAGGDALRAFSAAGYFFAKKLYGSLHVPIGMIASSVSGSAIEPWMSGEPMPDSLHQTGSVDESKPGKFYLGMIKPLAPFTLKGFLWYQGETNCFLRETASYTFKFRHLINSWRSLWNDGNAPLYFVQIAPFEYSKSKGNKIPLADTDLPAFRQAQAAALSLPHTGMIITTDLADNTADIHPTYKWEIGRRLALLALAHAYGQKMECSGPVVKKTEVKANTVEIEFDHAEGGLVSSDGAAPTGFEVTNADGAFGPAEATIRGKTVLLHVPSLSSPVTVRFAWHETAQPNLFNKDGLPAAPFEISTGKSSKGGKKE